MIYSNYYLKKALVLLLPFFMFSFYSFAQKDNAKNKIGMLILGSADLKTLEERIDVAYKLYASDDSFDYIIVSGGCGAHKSTICEASKMKSLLVEKGVPAEIIFKEEKSKNTVQNYVYSRILKNSVGETLIKPNDTLYVVSNHWHAIPVAARFTTYDGVQAFYHIEGTILPSAKDKVDYTDIYNKSSDNEAYSRMALWPLINASYSGGSSGKLYQFIGDLVFESSSDDSGSPVVARIVEMFPALPEDWQKGIDAAFYNASENKVYWLKGASYLRFTPNSKSIDRGYPKLLTDWVKDLPGDWRAGYIDAAFFHPGSKDLFLFKGEEYLKISSRSLKVEKDFPKKISTLVSEWPFGWGSGDVDAADYNTKEGKIYLYRGKELLKISSDWIIESGSPKSIKLERPEAAIEKNK